MRLSHRRFRVGNITRDDARCPVRFSRRAARNPSRAFWRHDGDDSSTRRNQPLPNNSVRHETSDAIRGWLIIFCAFLLSSFLSHCKSTHRRNGEGVVDGRVAERDESKKGKQGGPPCERRARLRGVQCDRGGVEVLSGAFISRRFLVPFVVLTARVHCARAQADIACAHITIGSRIGGRGRGW